MGVMAYRAIPKKVLRVQPRTYQQRERSAEAVEDVFVVSWWKHLLLLLLPFLLPPLLLLLLLSRQLCDLQFEIPVLLVVALDL